MNDKLPPVPNSADITPAWAGQKSIENTLKERGRRYGSLKGHGRITQALKEAMHNFVRYEDDQTRPWDKLSDDKKEALDMIAHKIGRILNGDPEYKDSWHDIIGYAKLVDDTLFEEGVKND